MRRGGQTPRNGRRHGHHTPQSGHIDTTLRVSQPPSSPSASPSASPVPSSSPLPSHSPSLSPATSPLPSSSPAPPAGALYSASDLFIRNLHPSTSAHTLHALCAPFGPIHSLRIIQTKTTPRYSREIAYLSYHLPQSAAAAVESLHGAYLDGRFLLVTPSRLMKDKRDWLFSGLEPSVRHDIQLDSVAEYSVTDSVTADTLTALLLAFIPADSTVTDACACVGGNTLSFARHFAHVQSCEFDRTRFDMLNHNLALLSSASTATPSVSVSTILASYLDVLPIWRQQAVFVDPPFGSDFELHSLVHPTLAELGMGQLVRALFQQSRPSQAVLLKLPRNVDWRRIMRELKGGGGGGEGGGDEWWRRVNVGKVHFPKLIALLFERELSGDEFQQRLSGAAIGGVREGVTRYVFDWTADAALSKEEGEERKVDDSAAPPPQQQQYGDEDEAAYAAQQQQLDGRRVWRDVSDWSPVDAGCVQQLAAHDPHEPFTPFAYARDSSSKARKQKKKMAKKATRRDEGLTMSVQNFFASFAAAGEEETAEDDDDDG